MSAPLPAGAAPASPAVYGGEDGAPPPTATQAERDKVVRTEGTDCVAAACLTAL